MTTRAWLAALMFCLGGGVTTGCGSNGDEVRSAQIRSAQETSRSAQETSACQGEARPCHVLTTSLDCRNQDGCFVNGRCTDPGLGTDCSLQLDAGNCQANGCTWTPPCQSVLACDTIVDASTCRSQTGCLYNAVADVCQPTNGCAVITSEQVCIDRPGCSWTTASFRCAGAATSCSSLSQGACNTQDGCYSDGG